MKWEKLGLIIKPQTNLWWMRTHAMIPTVDMMSESICKVYFSGRNEMNQSHIGYVLVDLNRPNHILEISKEPVLAPGALGCFDDNGVTPSCIVRNEKEIFLYYIGWNPGTTTRMHIFGGLAISKDDGKTFERYSRAPILERNRANPFINTAPFALKEENRWIIYYVGGVEWVNKDLPRYNIQIGFSEDGKNWKREGLVAIDFMGDENAIARPFVWKENSIYKMVFASKGEKNPNYRLKYAESVDGLNWIRKDSEIGIDVSDSGEDSEMIEYAALVNFKGKKIMFYNGNNYGTNGILAAVEI